MTKRIYLFFAVNRFSRFSRAQINFLQNLFEIERWAKFSIIDIYRIVTEKTVARVHVIVSMEPKHHKTQHCLQG